LPGAMGVKMVGFSGQIIRPVLNEHACRECSFSTSKPDNGRRAVSQTGPNHYVLYRNDAQSLHLLKVMVSFSILERLSCLGGNFDIESKLGYGTQVVLVAPLKYGS